VPGGEGFILSKDEAAEMLAQWSKRCGEVIRPFLIGADITTDPCQAPSRFIIDFHFETLEEAMRYPEALERIRQRVKPHRDRVRRRVYREKWWRLEEPITAMRTALRPLERYIACPAQGKRIYMVWCEPHWCPSNLTAALLSRTTTQGSPVVGHPPLMGGVAVHDAEAGSPLYLRVVRHVRLATIRRRRFDRFCRVSHDRAAFRNLSRASDRLDNAL
jgi:hypothetical protein